MHQRIIDTSILLIPLALLPVCCGKNTNVIAEGRSILAYRDYGLSLLFDNTDSLYGFVLVGRMLATDTLKVPDGVSRNTLIPGVGAFGIEFGDSAAQVMSLFGEPTGETVNTYGEGEHAFTITVMSWDKADSMIDVYFTDDSVSVIMGEKYPMVLPFDFPWRAHKSVIIKELGPSVVKQPDVIPFLPLIVVFAFGSVAIFLSSRVRRNKIFWSKVALWLIGWVLATLKLIPEILRFSDYKVARTLAIGFEVAEVQAVLAIIVALCGLGYLMLYFFAKSKRIITVVSGFIIAFVLLLVLAIIGVLTQDPVMGVIVFAHAFVVIICFFTEYIICWRGWLVGFLIAAVYLGATGCLNLGETSLYEAITWAVVYYFTVLIAGTVAGHLGQHLAKKLRREAMN